MQPNLSPIQECDVAMVQVAALEIIADLDDKSDLVDACKVVLDGLLEQRSNHLPQQRTSTENGGAACTGSPSAASAPQQS